MSYGTEAGVWQWLHEVLPADLDAARDRTGPAA